MEIFFPYDKLLHGPHNPPPPTQKNPPESVCTLPKNHYYV